MVLLSSLATLRHIQEGRDETIEDTCRGDRIAWSGNFGVWRYSGKAEADEATEAAGEAGRAQVGYQESFQKSLQAAAEEPGSRLQKVPECGRLSRCEAGQTDGKASNPIRAEGCQAQQAGSEAGFQANTEIGKETGEEKREGWQVTCKKGAQDCQAQDAGKESDCSEISRRLLQVSGFAFHDWTRNKRQLPSPPDGESGEGARPRVVSLHLYVRRAFHLYC